MWSIAKTMVVGLAALLLLANPALSASKDGITFYIQLVQGTDADMPPATGATLIGDALNRRLQMFRWKNYWEIQRQTVELSAGAKVRCHVMRKHEVEIALPTPTDMTVSIYLDGKLTRKRAQPVDTAFYIAGGDNDEKLQSWFIVVRRDKPQNAPAAAARSPGGNANQHRSDILSWNGDVEVEDRLTQSCEASARHRLFRRKTLDEDF